MSRHQLRMLREARRVGDPDVLLDLAEAAGVLHAAGWTHARIADLLKIPVQGNVSTEERLAEILEVEAFLEAHDALRVLARMAPADWHALVEPARWWRMGTQTGEELTRVIGEHVDRKGTWPRVDYLRRMTGRAGTHRLAGEGVPGQETLGEEGDEHAGAMLAAHGMGAFDAQDVAGAVEEPGGTVHSNADSGL